MFPSGVKKKSGVPATLAVVCCWLLPSAGTALAVDDLSLAQGLVVRTWGTEKGLPQNTVNAIVQTRDGYLWLATREGLARFDGVRFTVFGLRDGLQSVTVQTLFQDRAGILWIGTDGGGLSRMVDGQIETVSLPKSMAGEDSISALAEDSEGRLWVGTRSGLRVWDQGRFVQIEALAELTQTPVNALLRDRDGAMWVATATQGLYEFRNDRLGVCRGPPGNEQIAAHCLLAEQRGFLWASVGNGRLLCRQNEQWKVYDQADGVPYAYVTCLAEEADGTIWAGSLDEGIYCLRGERFVVLKHEQSQLGIAIRALRFDREGNLWVGTRTAGLGRLTRRKLMTVGPTQGLTNDFTRSVAETADGTLWVGTTGGGLYRGGLDAFEPFGDERIRFYPTVESVLAVSDGSLWWGGSKVLFHWKAGALAGFYTNLPWNRVAAVTALCEDREGGLWIGTSLGGLVHFDGDQFVEFPPGIARGAVTALAQQADGFLWVGSVAGGLKRVRRGSDSVFSVNRGLLSQSIRTLHLENDDTLWIGTAGGGLSRWRDGRVTSFTSRQGLRADTVSQIVEDDDGHLWLGCSRGIIRVNKQDLNELAAGQRAFVHPLAFGLHDGMPAEECSSGFWPAGLKTRSGLLCFSTVKGLVFINPHAQETNLPPPAVLLEEALVDGGLKRLQPVTETHGPRGSEMRVSIPAGRHALEVNYTAISFESPEEVSFRYRLEGWQDNWVEAGARRTAYFSELPPGNFIFRVAARNADTGWSEQEATLAITVQPYLWQTAWFRALAILVGIGLVAGAPRYLERRRYKRRLARLETQRAVERERLRISQDMHDHIGGMLTQVSQLSDLGQTETTTPGALGAQGHFERIGFQARAAVQALDEIVWATNPKNDNLPRFADYVSRFADEFFENSTVRCWQEVPAHLPNLPLRADVRHNVFLAVKEALNNVLKHSGATEVWLRLTLVDSEVCLRIEDNGHGFTPETAPPGGNGLGNMKSRLAECGGSAELASAPGHGVKLRFVFPMPKSV